MSSPIIQASGVSKHYVLGQVGGRRSERKAFTALDGVSFEVERGEVVGLIGHNGAGKSTLLKVLSRITEPSAGEITLRGRVASLLEVGTGFHPELTGRENIFLNGAILGMKKREIREKFDAIVDFAKVERFIDTPVKRYSTGMSVRLAFAVAAHLEAEILVVDEVLAVGDAAFQKRCVEKMDGVAASGRTVIFVSHNMGTISRLCSRSILLDAGRVAADGPTTETVDIYSRQQLHRDGNDLASLRLGGMGEDIEFTSIELARNPDRQLHHREPIAFDISFRAKRDLDHLTVGVTLMNIGGAPIGNLFTREPFSMRSGEERDTRLTVEPLRLAPGIYTAGFGLSHGDHSSSLINLDVVIGTPVFEVLPYTKEPSDEGVAHWLPGAWGNLVLEDSGFEILNS